MGKPYTYFLRPGYGSDKLLLEFMLVSSDTGFVKDLLTALKTLNPKIEAVEDLWMNDEVLLNVSSDEGAFVVTKDVWNFVFVIAENNQSCISLIDEILKSNGLFQKKDGDFENYRSLKS